MGGNSKWVPFLILALGILDGAFFIQQNSRYLTNFNDLVVVSGFLNDFSQSLWSGHLYPRWLMALSGGAGLPVFLYYPPLAFYFGSLFALPARLDPFGVYQLGMAMSAGLTVCALGYYFLLKRHVGVKLAGVIAALLLLTPLAFELVHTSMGLARIWALAEFPFTIYCLERWREEREKRFLLGFSALLALMIMTHIPSVILFAPLIWIYGCSYRGWSWKATGLVSLACLFGGALACIYLVPAVMNREFVIVDHYLFHFSTEDSFRFFSPVILLIAAPYLIWAVWSLVVCRKQERHIAICALVGLAAAVFLFPVSKPLWDEVALLHWLQTPSRFLSLFFALSPFFWMGIGKRMPMAAFIVITLLLQLPSAYMVLGEYDFYRKHSVSKVAQASIKRDLEAGVSSGEYTSVWMPPAPMPPEELAAWQKDTPRANIVQGKAEVKVSRWENEAIAIEVDAQTPVTIDIKQHYFPGWKAWSGEEALALYPEPSGLMSIELPAGKQRVRLAFSAVGAKKGALISLISLLAWSALFLYKPRRELAHR